MAESWDPDLRDEPADGYDADPHGPTGHGVGVWVVAALLAAAAVAAVYFAFLRPAPPDSSAAAQPPAAETPARPLGGPAEPIDLPPLSETDPIVRKLVSELSAHPRVAAWLATDGLIRNFTNAVVNISDGKTPAALVPVLRPEGRFAVRQSGEDVEIDPASYRRYDSLADAVNSIDAAGAARLYTMLKPRLEEAYRELGFPQGSFDAPLEKAITMLLDVPVVDGPLRVTAHGIGWRYEDDELESLTAGQKQLLRMGPRNVRIIQEKLRAILAELKRGAQG